MLDLIVAEGEPDFLTYATHWSAAVAEAPAVMGIWSGAWTETIAARIPDGTRVRIATHNDPAGHRYAARIACSLIPRCHVWRTSLE